MADFKQTFYLLPLKITPSGVASPVWAPRLAGMAGRGIPPIDGRGRRRSGAFKSRGDGGFP